MTVKKVETEAQGDSPIKEVTEERRESLRNSLSGTGERTHIGKKYNQEGYFYRWFNTSTYNDRRALELGYEPVLNEHKQTVALKDKGGETQVLMRISIADRKLLQDLREEQNMEMHRSIDPGLRVGHDGINRAVFEFKQEEVRRKEGNVI